MEMEMKCTAEWGFYKCSKDDKPVSISIEMGYSRIAPVREAQFLVWISVPMLKPCRDGLSSVEEMVDLVNIEDTLSGTMKDNLHALYVGRLTSGGNRIFYFYIQNIDQYWYTIIDAMGYYPQYSYKFGLKHEKDWDTYTTLLMPTSEQYRGMLNRWTINNLEIAGDNLNCEREVEHWINFKTELDRCIFIAKIKKDGFTIMNKYFDERYSDAPYSLQFCRFDMVDYESVDAYVIPLFRKAAEFGGVYKGWGAKVVK